MKESSISSIFCLFHILSLYVQIIDKFYAREISHPFRVDLFGVRAIAGAIQLSKTSYIASHLVGKEGLRDEEKERMINAFSNVDGNYLPILCGFINICLANSTFMILKKVFATKLINTMRRR